VASDGYAPCSRERAAKNLPNAFAPALSAPRLDEQVPRRSGLPAYHDHRGRSHLRWTVLRETPPRRPQVYQYGLAMVFWAWLGDGRDRRSWCRCHPAGQDAHSPSPPLGAELVGAAPVHPLCGKAQSNPGALHRIVGIATGLPIKDRRTADRWGSSAGAVLPSP
jgi:hypothetical protein